MIPLFPKHTGADTTIFSVMSALAQQYNAINLSQGFPDYPIEEDLGNLLYEASRKGFNQYAPMAGLPILQEAIATHTARSTGITFGSPNITITPGASYGIYTALATILQAGEEVIILEPAYDSYIPAIEMNGGIPVPVALNSPTFTINWALLEESITLKTKAIIVNTPHNPTGMVWQQSDWDRLTKLIAERNIYVLSDEVYEQVIFDGLPHCSVLSQPALQDRCFAIYSFGKAFHNTGWKVGYVVANEALTKAFRRVHQFLAFSVNTPAQYAIATYMQQFPLNNSGILLAQKRNLFNELMGDLPFTLPQVAKGSYFQVADYSAISPLPDTEFAAWLTKEVGVATIPISAFYKNGSDAKLIRFCFAKKEETLRAAIERMKAHLIG
ncbi:kynurenine--oxoglutarate aminotransferase [Taibaiella sp. KBW10]|uniref:methionine aminotransferase n=1 Tax=Taibaiella sp. KBW10 TaxID=2153357 RepID=UPI000F5A51DF|nr:methionine aminotransferase [Taibaiella sp. KBW10]RQO30749.1 kynurenine--oxoglutarate aminotransferase [Taibaiella sp. KBW10]